MTLFTYARNERDVPLFAVVVDDRDVEYVFPKGRAPFTDDPDKRLDELAESLASYPETEQEWLDLATSNLGQGIYFDHPEDELTKQQAVSAAKAIFKELEKGDNELDYSTGPTTTEQNIADAYDQVSQDYPDFDGDDPDAMLQFVAMALGPIDPEGPNGHIVRALEGNPREGDEDMFVTFAHDVTVESPDEED